MSDNLFLQMVNQRVLLSDGATGTNLQSRGLEKGHPGEKWVLENPSGIQQLHVDFVEAGSDVILTCTFGASEFLLKQHNLFEQQEKLVNTAVLLAKQAVGSHNVLVAGSMGPLGQLLQPLGLLTEEEAYRAYQRLADILSRAGVNLLVIETQFDIKEASVAINAAKAVTTLPIVCSFSFDRGTRTMMGVKPDTFAKEITALGIQAIGINCGKSIPQNLEVLSTVVENTELPVWFKPNAGLPQVDTNGNTIYTTAPEEMAQMALNAKQIGARIIGGCCGTTPQHLQAIAEAMKSS